MRRLTLHIAGQRADIDSSTLIQMNFTMEELTNPAVVKNSYSQQVTLEGTKTNNAIFGAFFRLDRRTAEGYNALAKTPFIITDELGGIVERGYVKLDEVVRSGASVQYKVTLYGGLGEYFYALSYKENGDKLTLADLDYLGTPTPDKELDFNISAEAVRSAWNNLFSGNDGKWSVINFAPCYNGIPEDFEADKGIFKPKGIAQTSVTKDGYTYTTRDGWSLVELDKEYDEWQTKDMRSYLQRPVVSLRKIVEAVADPKNNGGFKVSLDPTFFNDSNPYYAQAWITLPILRTIEQEQVAGRYPLTFTMDNIDESSQIEVHPSGSLLGASATFKLTLTPYIRLDEEQSLPVDGDELSMGTDRVAFELIAYDGNTIVGRSGRKAISSESDNPEVEDRGIFFFDSFTRTGEWSGNALTLEIGATENVTRLVLEVVTSFSQGYPSVTYDGQRYTLLGYGATAVEGESYADAETFPNARTGSLITKKMLLSSDATPADYLLSYCKAFGLHFLYDKADRSISIVSRDILYDGETIDLTERIDYSKPIEVQPFAFDAKWYDFGWEYEEGAYAEYYEQTQGRPYGLRRINTGYDFDRETKQILDGNIYKGAVESLGREKYYLNLGAGSPIPPPFLDGVHKYQLYNGGASTEVDCPTPTASTPIEYWNPDLPTYDKEPKMQFVDADNGAVDIRDVLCFYRGAVSNYADMRLSDDTPLMLQLNDGNPCWVLNGLDSMMPIYLPSFGRHLYDGDNITDTWDFGVPAELDMPNAQMDEGATLYNKGWQRYLADRYDIDSKVVKCHVRWNGLQVGNELMRKFFFFEGSLWVLNAIRNYALGNDAPAECEFVKVKSKNNYKRGIRWQN